jgi:hypothetical protein
MSGLWQWPPLAGHVGLKPALSRAEGADLH